MFARKHGSALANGREETSRRRALRGLAVAAAFASAISMSGVAAASPGHGQGSGQAASSVDFGPNVLVFTPSMSTADIQSKVDAIADQQDSNQFGTQRYALLFEPGTYGTTDNPLIFQVGYYTQVAGLGATPNDVTINGAVNVYNQCLAPDNCTALVNFWRSLSNLTINVDVPNAGCRTNTEFWAVSQAAPMRRVNINGNTTLMDYCTAGPQYASGGYIANSAFSGGIVNGSQQQFYVRDSSIGGAWSNAVWNQVFSGVVGAPAQGFPNRDTGTQDSNGNEIFEGPYTTLDTTPATRNAPYLYIDSTGKTRVFVPAAQKNSRGTSWGAGHEAGRSLAISDFFVANPGTSVNQINAQLARGKSLILTPGVYNLSRSILVMHPDTVVLGLGFATLVPQNGNPALVALPNNGVSVSGLIIDAGPRNSPVLMSVGIPGLARDWFDRSAADPDLISDVFFRIGGAATTATSANVSLMVNADNAIIDHVWAWRADHGNAVGWTVNKGDTGLMVNGDNVTATGLFVEHYQKREVIWNGNGGTTIFFQNELPYDVPSQDAWNASKTQLGYPAFTVSPHVRIFNGYGMGSYVVFIQTTATIYDDMAFQSPTRPGVQFKDLLTIYIDGSGGYNSVINGVGGPDTSENPGDTTLVPVVSYP